MERFKQYGYKTNVIICTCPKEVSWQSTIDRGDLMKSHLIQPRYVAQESHDYVVEHLGENAQKVFESNLVDQFQIYSRSLRLFDSKEIGSSVVKEIIKREVGITNI